MVLGETRFPHKRIHKGTWKSPDNETFDQINHNLIDATHSSDVMDVRSYRDPNEQIDELLVVIKVR